MMKTAKIASLLLLAMSLTACSSNNVTTAETYEVKNGDTVYAIACNYAHKHADKNININKLSYDIRTLNNINDGLIVPGQKLRIPAVN